MFVYVNKYITFVNMESHNDWYIRGIQDRDYQDGLESEEQTNTQPIIPPVPKVKPEGYNAFDSFTKQDWIDWHDRYFTDEI